MTQDINGKTIKGLKAAAGETKHAGGNYSGKYVQISYNTETGEVLTDYHVSLGCNSWTEYHDKAIVHVCNAENPMTMAAIAESIGKAIARRNQ